MSGDWLVTGAGGMLGRDLLARLRSDGEQVVGLGHAELDVGDGGAVDAAVREHRPAVVVNCAAYTAVDAAETDEPAARRVNGDGPAHLARACAATGARLVQVSTDYVFAGDARTPYAEDAATGPRTAYGRTKLAGERAVLGMHPEGGCVARTAWLYGAHGPNFVATMIGLAASRPTVDVVADQTGQPTWTGDLAGALTTLGRADGARGTYHVTNSGQASWYELARQVFTLLGADPDRVRPVTTDRFPRPAPRPAYGVLASTRYADLGLAPLRGWGDALAGAFPQLTAGG